MTARCGPTSTTIGVPNLGPLSQVANSVENRLELTSAFSSSNPVCPIFSTTLIEGYEQFLLTVFDPVDATNTLSSFSIALKNSLVPFVDRYYYTIVATAQGGASGHATGVMEVKTGQYDCMAPFVGVSQSEYRFSIPREGLDIEQTLFENSYLYYTPSQLDCVQTYELFMVNGSPLPDYYTFDTETGFLSFTNHGDRTISDSLMITIYSAETDERLLDFSEQVIQRTQPFSIVTECGPMSALVTEPVLPVQEQPAYPDRWIPLLYNSSFTSSNPSCPIETYTLFEGSSRFNIESGITGFDVRLKTDWLQIPDIYYYTVRATARGGAFADESSSMIIREYQPDISQSQPVDGNSCTGADILNMVHSKQDICIPRQNQELATVLFTESLEYISSPSNDCTQTFSLEMADGASVPDYYYVN